MVIKGSKEEADKSILFSKSKSLKKYFTGVSPDLLIGSYGYPFVNVGILSTENKFFKNINELDSLDINSIIKERQSLINSKLVVPVKKVQERIVEQSQEIARSNKVLDTEVSLNKPISFFNSFHQVNLPHGPSAELKKLEITSSVPIKPFVERLTNDVDVKANIALEELSDHSVDEYQLVKLLSSGSLGRERKLVPTKWAITAVDDTLGRRLLSKINVFDHADYSLFYDVFLGNVFIVLVMPGSWSFELLEITQANTIHNSSDDIILGHDYEFSNSRTKYVKETSGAFYSARLAVLEYLNKINRQARVVVFRIITKDYKAPLGVWVVREGVRKTLDNKSLLKSGVENNIFNTITSLFLKNDILDYKVVFDYSILLRERQLELKEWF